MIQPRCSALIAPVVALAALLATGPAQADEIETIPSNEVEREPGAEGQPAPVDREARTKAPEVDLDAVTDEADPRLSKTRTYPEPAFGYETQSRSYPNVPLLVTSTTVFTIGYVPAVIGAAVSDRDDDDLYYPVAGPWLAYANDPDENAGQKTLLVLNGVFQGVGALGMLSSFFIPQSRTREWYLLGDARFNVVPRGTGLMARGSF